MFHDKSSDYRMALKGRVSVPNTSEELGDFSERLAVADILVGEVCAFQFWCDQRGVFPILGKIAKMLPYHHRIGS